MILFSHILAKKGLFLQEFLGFKFEIVSNKRIKNYFLKYNVNGHLIFGFPLHAKNKLDFVQTYINRNSKKIQNIIKKQYDKQQTTQQQVFHYIRNHPNTLVIFNHTYDINSLSIEYLSAILYDKCILLLDEIAGNMGLHYSKLSISYVKGYLGQCKGDSIKIDYRNILNTEELLRYLITHELSHIRHRNHSPRFWMEVATYFPNYKQARKELKVAAHYNAAILKHYGLLPQRLQ